MKVLLVHPAQLPVFAYGGTERVVWDLGKALVALGHQVVFLAAPGSTCPFAPVREWDPTQPLLNQINPLDQDMVHFQVQPPTAPSFPHLITEHGNSKTPVDLLPNTVFLSANHATRHGSTRFVHNGLDWAAYGPVNLDQPRHHLHFLGKAAWRVKNLRGAIGVARGAHKPMVVLGGTRLNFRRGFRFTPWPSIRFMGMVGGTDKHDALNRSQGMVFPVRWHEPFGLAVIESLYFGCPVFATPYGALPELVTPDCGVLAPDAATLVQAIEQLPFHAADCHRRALQFDHLNMAKGYLDLYEQVLAGECLHHTPPRLSENGHQLLPWSTT